MKIKVNYIEGQESSSAFGVTRISEEMISKLRELVEFKKINYRLPLENSLLKQFFIYFLYPIKLTLRFLNSTDIIHISNQGYAHIAHFLPKDKLIITCCDLIPLVFSRNNNLGQNILLKFSFSGLNKAKKIIAISQSTKNDLISYLKIPSEKIEVIHPGINQDFKPMEIEKKNFILYVGAYYPSKNLPILFKAFARVSKKLPKLKLLIVNEKNNLPKELASLIRKLKIEDKVNFTGHISELQLIKLYNQAQLLVQPSLYEGFGLPVLEAMACGCPTVCSNTASLPEVVGNVGILISPRGVESLAKAIYNVIKDKKLQKQLTEKGLRQAKKFSWGKTTSQVYRIYQSLL